MRRTRNRTRKEFDRQASLQAPNTSVLDHGLRVLLVEDSATDAELVEREMTRGGLHFECKRVQTKDFYSQALNEFSPDIVLADFSLPHFSGLEALWILKEAGFHIPFILVTGSQSEEVAVRCMKEGADDYILKQSLTRLPSAILNALEKRDAEAARLRAVEALRRSEERFHLLFDHAPLPIWVYDITTLQFLEVNNAAVERYGYSRTEFLTMRLSDLQEPPDFVPSQQLPIRYFRHRRQDGQFIDVQIIAHTIEFFGSQAVLMISEDITERRKAEEIMRASREQLRQLSAHLQSVREEERTRIAREIHDEFGQALTALKIDLALLERTLGRLHTADAHPLLAKTQQMSSLIDTTLGSIHRLATELRPGILDDLGLEAAVEWQAQEFQSRTGVHIEYISSVRGRPVPQNLATPVFRIFQETLTNITRHAEATKVWVFLDLNRERLLLEVRDNGKGASEADLSKPQSLGILGMRERALLLGGEFSITGTPSGGTTVLLIVPLRQS